MSDRKHYTLADALAERQGAKRGDCSGCERADVPINDEGICFPCGMKRMRKQPGLERAIDVAAEKKMRAMIGWPDNEPKD